MAALTGRELQNVWAPVERNRLVQEWGMSEAANTKPESSAKLFDGAGPCLDELEFEYLVIGIEKCKGLEDRSHLSAFLILGIRSICLLRAMLRLADPQFLDAYDTVRRSFVESWQLQFEFRLRESATKAQKWLEGVADTWNADRGKLETLIRKLQGGNAGFAREWGELSAMSHPTFDAARNSVAIASTIDGMNPNPEHLDKEFAKLTGDFVGMLNREIWLTIETNAEFIETHLKPEKFPQCLELHKRFLESTPTQQNTKE